MQQFKRIILAFAVMLPVALSAQKIGYINRAEILQAMPEYTAAQKTLEDEYKKLENDIKDLQTELAQKEKEIRDNQKTWSEVRMQSEMEAYQGMASRVQRFQQQAQLSIAKKEQELIKPLVEKIRAAAEAVAKEKGLNYVLDGSGGEQGGSIIIYGDSNLDVTDDVKKKLGIPVAGE